MAELRKETEATPETFADTSGYVSLFGGMVAEGIIWERIESYIRTRYSQRLVTWKIEAQEGEDWIPPLGPVVTFTAEKWESGAWVATVLPDGPLGICIPSDGTFRIMAQVGKGPVPAGVGEAFARLAKYVSAIQRTPGERFAMRKVSQNGYDVRPESQTLAQDQARVEAVDGSAEFATNWPAKAIQLSGAADLLRPYRRQK